MTHNKFDNEYCAINADGANSARSLQAAALTGFSFFKVAEWGSDAMFLQSLIFKIKVQT